MHDAIYDALRDVEGDNKVPLITVEEDITDEWRELPGIAACLQMKESGQLAPDKTDAKNAKQSKLKKKQLNNTKNRKKITRTCLEFRKCASKRKQNKIDHYRVNFQYFYQLSNDLLFYFIYY